MSGPYDKELQSALAELGDDPGRASTRSPARCARGTYILAVRPELAWQQLHNPCNGRSRRCSAELARGSAPGTDPSLRTRTPFRESKALLHALAGHTEGVWGCAVSPDGAFLLSASEDGRPLVGVSGT